MGDVCPESSLRHSGFSLPIMKHKKLDSRVAIVSAINVTKSVAVLIVGFCGDAVLGLDSSGRC